MEKRRKSDQHDLRLRDATRQAFVEKPPSAILPWEIARCNSGDISNRTYKRDMYHGKEIAIHPPPQPPNSDMAGDVAIRKLPAANRLHITTLFLGI
jgi:hypothetical protein